MMRGAPAPQQRVGAGYLRDGVSAAAALKAGPGRPTLHHLLGALLPRRGSRGPCVR